ncbi:RING-H2 finger protein ATL80-like [Vicia villosa]|uniref:RING-H2 finger protein ATL80-like n=1 Tax=Vicia villosa TaxID=3911 RepID=UPI00273A84B8|nr:RING-H2 finger protein ATL80-like [Vicia villosa]
MTRPFRYLDELNSSSSDSPDSAVVDSDFVVILAALLCALICVLGLIAVSRCGCFRRLRLPSPAPASQTTPPAAAANKGVKKKVLRSLPKVTATEESAVKFSDCAICLSEFTAGDEIRVLPQCGHGFHVSCIDAWLRSHSSCPSCRQILVVSRCDKCGGIPAPAPETTAVGSSSTAAPESEVRLKVREDDVNSFLP